MKEPLGLIILKSVVVVLPLFLFGLSPGFLLTLVLFAILVRKRSEEDKNKTPSKISH